MIPTDIKINLPWEEAPEVLSKEGLGTNYNETHYRIGWLILVNKVLLSVRTGRLWLDEASVKLTKGTKSIKEHYNIK